jgi:hypothetical protein
MGKSEHRRKIEQLKKEFRSAHWPQKTANDHVRVQDATNNPFLWATAYTETYNEHWKEEGRPSPYEPFPAHLYLDELFQLMQIERILWIEKSRDMMITWACMAYLTLQAMILPERGVLVQAQKQEKAKQLIKYAKCLYSRQPKWLRNNYPLEKPLDSQPDSSLTFANGSSIVGIPGGADQIRSYHPWAYLNDESSFQPDAGECYNEALAAVKGKIIFNSSAGPGWYADARHDVVFNVED